jgi:PAS domain S-box-containing protein
LHTASDPIVDLVIVEDSGVDAELVADALLAAGLKVQLRRVEDAAAFLSALDDRLPDAILADWTMPRFSGSDALGIAHERCPDVPFIFVSGTISETIAIAALRQGAIDYVYKHQLQQLGPSLERALEQARGVRLLRQSEAFNRAILSSVSAEIAVLDRAGVIIAVNSPWQRYALENAAVPGNPAPGSGVGTNYLAACRTDATDPAKDEALQALDGIVAVLEGRLRDFSFVYPCHSPLEERWFSMSVTPLQRQEGGVVVSHVDVTARIKSEATLAKERGILKTLFRTLPDLVWLKDPEGTFLACNPRFEGILGATEQEIVGKTDFEFFPREVAERFRAADRLTLQAGVPIVNQEEVRFVIDGHSELLETIKTPMFGDNGALIGVLGVGRDISLVKRNEEQLRRLSQVVEQNPATIIITRLDASIDYVNEAFSRSTGFSREEAMGRNPRLLQSGRTTPQTYAALWETILRGETWRGEMINRRKDGSELTEFSTITPLRQPGGPITHYVAVQEDITEKKRLALELDEHRHHLEELVAIRTRELVAARELAESATNAKTDFLANMSHEIRSPLNAILGLAYLLEQSRLEPQAQSTVRKIRASGRMLLGLISDILDMSKIEAGQMQIEQVPFRLDTVMDNVAVAMGVAVGDKDIELVMSPLPAGVECIRGDGLRVEQILVNLSSNAVKFTKTGSIQLRINVRRGSGGPDMLRFSIEDTGIGIAPEFEAAIFSPFAQADTSITRRFGGTGLGLAICRQLVRLMGGEIGVISAPGKGSEFWFTLPLEQATDPNISAPSMSSVSLLLADDNEISLKAIAETAQRLGWQVSAVGNGAAAVAQVLERQHGRPVDVVLLDWHMPTMDGLAAARLIRQKVAPSECLIILMAATNAFTGLASRPEPELLDGILHKPVTSSALYNAVIEAQNRHATRTGVLSGLPQAPNNALAGLRLLVVDDSDINREVAQRILVGQGAVVTLAEDGQQAIDWLMAHPKEVDLVLMDVQMPVLDGIEAARRLRRLPQFVDLPIVALTAGALKSQQDAAIEAGMTHFVRKPFDIPATIALIHRLCLPFKASQPMVPAPGRVLLPASPNYVATETSLSLRIIDVSQGLALWGDAVKYQSYLRRFLTDYSDTAATIVDRLDHDARTAAAALAHKLGGVCANLALPDTRQAAQALEALLASDGDPAAALAQLRDSLAAAVVEINRYMAPAAVGVDPPGAAPENSPCLTSAQREALKYQLARLLPALDSDNAASVS